MVSAEAWAETARGLERRAKALRERIGAEAVDELMDLAMSVARQFLVVVDSDLYSEHEAVAR